MSIIRKTPIYGNCQVFGPTGKLMFRCLEKRAKWYLDRKLAVITIIDPLSIQLTFTPKGGGETTELLKMERQNKCVVCGTENLDVLTRHHLVPFVYRQHFPPERKKHSSLFVVPICRNCHNVYENDFASKLKMALAEIYSAPFNGTFDIARNKVLGIIKCLRDFKDQIPQDRKNFLISKLDQNAKDLGISVENLLLDGEIDKLELKIKNETVDKAERCHGKVVVNRVANLDEFENMWAKHFSDNMSPKFMPPYITDHFA